MSHPDGPLAPAVPRPDPSLAQLLLGTVILAGAWVLFGIAMAGALITRPPPLLTGILFVLPLLFSLHIFLSALAALFQRGRFPRLAAALVALIWLAIWGRVWAAWPASEAGEPLRVMSWNVQRLGWDGPDHAKRVDCVVEEIQEARPDALVLLEVTAADVEELSKRLDLSCEQVDYKGTRSRARGGLAACGMGAWRLGKHAPRRFSNDTRWYYVFTELVKGDRVVNLLAVHLQPYRLSLEGPSGLASRLEAVSEAQQQDTATLLERVGALRDPTVVAGDFNSPRDAALHVSMRRHLTDAWEQAGWGPGGTVHLFGQRPVRIDYIDASDDVGVRGASIPSRDCSDHRSVVADLRWRPGG